MFRHLSDQILEERDHVRDVYTHRKGFPSPLLVLEFLDQEFAFNKRQAQVHQPNCTRLLESGRTLFRSFVIVVRIECQ